MVDNVFIKFMIFDFINNFYLELIVIFLFLESYNVCK